MKNLRQSKNSNVKQKILIFITALIITMSLVKLADILLGYVNKDMEDNSSSNSQAINKTSEYNFSVKTTSEGFRGRDYPVF